MRSILVIYPLLSLSITGQKAVYGKHCVINYCGVYISFCDLFFLTRESSFFFCIRGKKTGVLFTWKSLGTRLDLRVAKFFHRQFLN